MALAQSFCYERLGIRMIQVWCWSWRRSSNSERLKCQGSMQSDPRNPDSQRFRDDGH
jgi:hypothetical protein